MKCIADERGSIMLLAIAFIGITLLAIATVTDAAAIFRQHRALVAIADGAALAGVQGIDIDTYYAQGATLATTLDTVHVEALVQRYVTSSQRSMSDSVTIEALTIHSGVVTVTLATPMRLTFLPQFASGPMRATGAAQLDYRGAMDPP